MIVADSIATCRAAREPLGPVAFVPTMGALHAGHLSLVAAAREHAPRVAVSIFVNPTQFGPSEDFSRYPRPVEDDLALCREAGVDLVFLPGVQDIYPPGGIPITLDVPSLTNTLDGVARPGHFQGVCQVVAKLFNIVQPSVACFGEKDFQQLAVLTAMTRALDFPIRVVGCPTLREPDGLAMSSRNRYLSPLERRRALAISRGLFTIRDQAAAGETSVAALTEALHRIVTSDIEGTGVPTSLDYATIVDATTLGSVDQLGQSPTRALVALRVGTTRLIDNIALPASDRPLPTAP